MKTRTKLYIFIPLLLLISIGGYMAYASLSEPQNMRFSSGPVKPSRFASDFKRCKYIDRTGLKEANFSGSGSLIIGYLEKLKDKMKSNITVINGMTELTQISFLNGRTLYFLCYEWDGTNFVEHPCRKGPQCFLKRLIGGAPLHAEDVDLSDITPEAQIMDELGIPYASPLPFDFTSNWAYVEELLDLFEKIDPQKTHVLFHCTRGRGRTTTLMTMYDIFHNHKDVSFQDIIDRQYCLGGEDLLDTSFHKKGTWKPESLVNRKKLAIAFYDYMTDLQGYGHMSWTQWLDLKKAENYAHLPLKTDREGPHREAA